jgi:hypothetical protein
VSPHATLEGALTILVHYTHHTVRIIIYASHYTKAHMDWGDCWYSMITPLIRMPIKGTIWYQGETGSVHTAIWYQGETGSVHTAIVTLATYAYYLIRAPSLHE